MNNEIRNYIETQINNADPDRTTVISLRPGSGKSQYIIYRISEAIRNKQGLLVVTDSIERLEGMSSADGADDEIATYIKRNENKIALLTADTFQTEIKVASYKPVVAMTTQRFFKMSPVEINSLISANQFGIKTIMIDEQPDIIKTINISIEELNIIDSAINTSLSNLIDPDDKQLLLSSFQQIDESFRDGFQMAESSHDAGTWSDYYYKPELADASTTFARLANKYKSELQKYNCNIMQMIGAVSMMASDGAMLISQKIGRKDDANKYCNFLSIVKDYAQWYTSVNARIIIFDGTASLNPYYQRDFFQVINCDDSKLLPDLNNLTINLIDINTSKSKMMRDSDHRQALIDYLLAQPEVTQAVFTNQATEKYFDDVAELTGHFQNLKGFNKFRNLTNITQIGLHRMPDYVYKYLCGYSNGLNINTERNSKSVTRIISKDRLIDYRNQLLLADIEQNLFRSKIRNADNNDPVVYNIISAYNGKDSESMINAKLADMIQSRYTQMGATVNRIDTPIEIQISKAQSRNVASETKPQKIFNWLYSKDIGYIFRKKELRDDLGFSDAQLNSAILGSPVLKDLFAKMKISRGLYQRLA